MMHDVRLAGWGVRLDPLEVADAAALWPLTDDDLWAGMVTPRPESIAAYGDHVEAQLANPTTLAFTVRGEADGRVRGTTTFYDLVPAQRRVEIGSTWYGREFWGGRTNPATKLLLLGHAFDAMGLNRVALRCDARNLRSAAAIRRLGAVPEGVLREHRVAADGTTGDTAYFSIVRAGWPEVRAGLEARLA